MDPETLQVELLECLDEIKTEATNLKAAAQSMGIDVAALRDTAGTWVYAPLLGAKAQVLHALAILETEGDLSDGTEGKEGSNGQQ